MNEGEYKKYQYLKYNPSTNETVTSIVTLMGSERISGSTEDGKHYHLSTVEEDGSLVLISHMGETEYMCKVKCLCNNQEDSGFSFDDEEDDDNNWSERRMIGGYYTELAFMIVFSVMLGQFGWKTAIEEMTDAFRQRCLRKLNEEMYTHYKECLRLGFSVTVEECYPFIPQHKMKRFVCEGECEPNPILTDHFLERYKGELIGKGLYDSLEQTAVQRGSVCNGYHLSSMMSLSQYSDTNDAKIQFIKRHLENYCHEVPILLSVKDDNLFGAIRNDIVNRDPDTTIFKIPHSYCTYSGFDVIHGKRKEKFSRLKKRNKALILKDGESTIGCRQIYHYDPRDWDLSSEEGRTYGKITEDDFKKWLEEDDPNDLGGDNVKF